MDLFGFQIINGAKVDRLLRISTIHMPSLHEDLSAWCFKAESNQGTWWFYGFEEPMNAAPTEPEWLKSLASIVKKSYDCNWFVLEPDGQLLAEAQIFSHD